MSYGSPVLVFLDRIIRIDVGNIHPETTAFELDESPQKLHILQHHTSPLMPTQRNRSSVELDAKTNLSDVFSRHEFHYLNVPNVGTITVDDIFDCTFECLQTPTCVSVNLAVSKGADGKLWCEILSSGKYLNPTEFKENVTSHHFSKMITTTTFLAGASHRIKELAIDRRDELVKLAPRTVALTPCSSNPCQNGGICEVNYKDDTFKCDCEKSFIGIYCETAAKSCKELYDAHNCRCDFIYLPDIIFSRLFVNQLVTLHLGPTPTTVLCHVGDFGCGDGVWTTVMKIDGSKSTFHYNSAYWNDRNEYNLPGGETGFDSQETKLPTYWNTSFSKICLGMKIGQQTNFVIINKQANSLYSLIADGQYRGTSLGRNTWKTLIGSQASLQYKCNKEGFNSFCTSRKARIGIISNNRNACSSCDSRIGFGTGGPPDDSITCGNVAKRSGDNGERFIKTMGYILVQ
ncbi:uncharacterized protein LOC110055274 [Orbicella faveolata]|uniref:uncharacterized protein LOC110055274 n=1 Tax=Orbicella faveolata TaxID=48498 RepID=UPI0009E4A8B4|nr:uncharacterized protein LOC110055274 [Orbicella faveolata]